MTSCNCKRHFQKRKKGIGSCQKEDKVPFSHLWTTSLIIKPQAVKKTISVSLIHKTFIEHYKIAILCMCVSVSEQQVHVYVIYTKYFTQEDFFRKVTNLWSVVQC